MRLKLGKIKNDREVVRKTEFGAEGGGNRLVLSYFQQKVIIVPDCENTKTPNSFKGAACHGVV